MLSDFFKGKRILVTGHTGFKGGWLSHILLNMGAEVSGCSLAPDTEPNLFSVLGLEKRTNSHILDIRRQEGLAAIFQDEDPEIVLHLAAQPLVRQSYEDPLYTFSTNVMGTANVLECARTSASVKSVVVVTTDKVYEDKGGARPYREDDELGGYDPYAASKVCAEHVSRSYRRSFFNPDKGDPRLFLATARSGNVVGGGDWSKDRLVPDMVRAFLEKGEEATLRNPKAIRPWQHVLDPLFGYLLLAKRLYEKDKEAASAWNFAPEEENFITVEELAQRSIKLLGKGTYSLTADKDRHETEVLKLDAGKAKRHLGWKPVLGIDESLEWTMRWYSDFYSAKDVVELTDSQIGSFMERIDYG